MLFLLPRDWQKVPRSISINPANATPKMDKNDEDKKTKIKGTMERMPRW